MSRKQGPRAAGMRPSAIAVSRRHGAFGNFTAIMRGDGMSRKQGPLRSGDVIERECRWSPIRCTSEFSLN